MARGESMRQFDKDEFRRRASGRYKGGGSSRQPQGLGRSATIRERGKEATRHTSIPAEQLATAEIELEKSRAQSKQPKLNTKWLMIQKEKLHKAFENFIVHNRLPFNIVGSPWTRPLLRTAAEVRPNISPPSAYEISEFHKFIDASNVERKDAEYYFKIMKEVVEEIDPEKVIQVVTDNEAAIKAGGKKIMKKFPNL
ncbi:hypothetical protein GH714_021236 [Hevea brasiliensis]|uniref:DUF659 domain-containing protein n=1 Tax=Hevea brasiliensis TaxID=3981 RepID=A0A6A6L795_HEVBR|nr:hypothetical protein GH714_021236 [Hevea brasiliensis]